MKGGNYMALEAIRQLPAPASPTRLPITVLLTSDEEIGSPSTRDLIEAEAARHRYVLVPEPARADGGVVTGRYAIARFNLEATGRPSHAGARLADGRSAIREMARKLIEIEDMTTEDCTFSVGVIHGGAVGELRRHHLHRRGAVDGQAAGGPRSRCRAHAGAVGVLQRRAVQGDARRDAAGLGAGRQGMALYGTARGIARGLGYDINPQSSGGGSDGNFTGAMGIATLDGLGVQGAGAHTLDEHILVDSLATAAELMAGLLATLG